MGLKSGKADHTNDATGNIDKIAIVIPCYRETRFIADVISAVPNCVDLIYCIDDGCPDKTGDFVERTLSDPRIKILRHQDNQGVGAATLTGYRKAIADGADIIVKIDGDGQMDPTLIPRFIEPIQMGLADYTKGNRFFQPDSVRAMPAGRLIGNAVLSFLNKFSSGYWHIFDPTNGYCAIHSSILQLIPLEKLDRSYLFETEMLYRLGSLRAVVVDIPHKSIYGDEQSHLVPSRMIWPLLSRHTSNFFRRIFYNYFLRDFSVASVEWVLGPILMLFGSVFGVLSWVNATNQGVAATAGTVMIAALPIVIGLNLLLSALNFDIASQPRTPLHPKLSKAPDAS